MRFVEITCACGAVRAYPASHVNRSRREGRPLFCSRKCSAARHRTTAEAKAEYKRNYRKRYSATHQSQQHDYFANYYASHRDESLAAAKEWYANNKAHVARRGKLWRARRFFGPYAEAYLIWLELDREIRRLVPDKYERLKARGCYARYNENKKERRRREKCQATRTSTQ